MHAYHSQVQRVRSGNAPIRACDLFVLLWSHDARASDYVPLEIGIAVGCDKTILPVVMEDNVPIPGSITNLKYLAAHKDWNGSFQWLMQFVHDNAMKLRNGKVLGAVAATILGGICLFGGDYGGEDDEEDSDEGDD